MANGQRPLALVKRTLHATPQQVCKTAYETLVRRWSTPPVLDRPTPNLPSRRLNRFSALPPYLFVGITSMCSTLEWDTLEQRRRLREVTLFYKIKHGLVGITLHTSADPCRLPNSMSEHQQATSSDIFMPHLPVFVLRPLCTSLEPSTSVGNRRPDSSTVPDGRLPNHPSPVMLQVGF